MNTYFVPLGTSRHNTLRTLAVKDKTCHIWWKWFPYLNQRRNSYAHQRRAGQQWTLEQIRTDTKPPPQRSLQDCFRFISHSDDYDQESLFITDSPGFCLLLFIVPFILKTKWMINQMSLLPLTLQPSLSHLFSYLCPFGAEHSVVISFSLIGWSVLIFDWHFLKTFLLPHGILSISDAPTAPTTPT